MGVDDRDWMREDRKRRAKLVWNDKSGEMEFEPAKMQRRWQWPYRLRPDLPYWVRWCVRAVLFVGALGLLYLAWMDLRP